MPQQGGMQQNPAGGYQAPAFQQPQNAYPQGTPAFGYPPVQNGNGYNAAQPSAVPPTPAAVGYAPTPQMSATGGYSQVQQAPAAGGYNPMPPAAATGGYNPMQQQAPVNAGYSPVPPAAAGTGYTQQPAPAAPTGSFIPRTPYSPGYTTPGYQPAGYQKPAANGYPQGYSAYTQMGRTSQQNPAPAAPQQAPSQVPLNGGGYVPNKVNIRRRPMERSDIMLLAVSGVLILLFILGLTMNGGTSLLMKLLFLIPAAGAIAMLWWRPVTAENKRLCFTIVAGVLCVIMAISAFTNTKQPTDRTNKSGSAASQSSDTDSGNASGSGTNVINNLSAYGGSNVQQTQTASATPTPTPNGNVEAFNRVVEFFGYWSLNELDKMVELCPPSWRVKQENAKKSLFQVLQNRTPVGDITLRNDPPMTGDSLNFLFDVTISRNNGKPSNDFRMNVRMVKENGEWYVDPNSLVSNEVQETPDPNATPVPTNTPEPQVDANTMLYYNPDGGKLYHLDQNCMSLHSRYLPLKGSFRYSQINDQPYAALEPCNVCGAPLRNK